MKQVTRTPIDPAKARRIVPLEKLLQRVPDYTEPQPSAGGDGGGAEEPPKKSTGGGYDEIRDHKTGRSILLGSSVAALLLTRACSWTPEQSSHTLAQIFGKWAYVVLLAFSVAYFVRLLINAPLGPNWYAHVMQAKQTRFAITIILAVGTVQVAVKEWNHAYGTGFSLPETLFSTLIPVSMFAVYSLIVPRLSTVKVSYHDQLYEVGDPHARPFARYVLTLLFWLASVASGILATHRILEVFRAFPETWYEPYLFLRWWS